MEIKKTVSDPQQDSMLRTWIDFCRQSNISQDCLPFENDEWFAWMDFVPKHYREPLPVSAGTDWSND